MSNIVWARLSASLFGLWGLMHIAGAAVILLALGQSPAAGYAIYQNAVGEYPPLAGAALGYLAFFFACIGATVTAIAALLNWRGSTNGLVMNLLLAGLTDLGLIMFLVVPGYVTLAEASAGFVLLVAGALAGAVAYRGQAPRVAAAR